MRAVGFVALVVVLAGGARADVIVTMESKDLTSDPPAVRQQQILMGTDRLRTRMLGDTGPSFEMIYRGDRQVVWALDEAGKTYTELDKATMSKMGEQLSAAMKQMQEQMAKMPPEQRKMVEQAMKGNMAGGMAAAEPKIEIRKTSERQTVNGHACVRHDVLVDGKQQSEVWVASWGDMGVPKESFAVYKDLASFYQDLFKSIPGAREGARRSGMFEGADRIDGIPVLARSLNEAGKPVSEVLFKSVESKKIEAALFEIPAGYKKREMMAH